MHSAGLELTKLTYTRLEDNLIRRLLPCINAYLPLPFDKGCLVIVPFSVVCLP